MREGRTIAGRVGGPGSSFCVCSCLLSSFSSPSLCALTDCSNSCACFVVNVMSKWRLRLRER